MEAKVKGYFKKTKNKIRNSYNYINISYNYDLDHIFLCLFNDQHHKN